MKLHLFNGGLNIRQDPLLIAPNEAVECTNVDTSTGVLKSAKGPTVTAISIENKPFYYESQDEWQDRVDALDYMEYQGLLYWTTSGRTQKYDGTNVRNLGINEPTIAPNIIPLTKDVDELTNISIPFSEIIFELNPIAGSSTSGSKSFTLVLTVTTAGNSTKIIYAKTKFITILTTEKIELEVEVPLELLRILGEDLTTTVYTGADYSSYTINRNSVTISTNSPLLLPKNIPPADSEITFACRGYNDETSEYTPLVELTTKKEVDSFLVVTAEIIGLSGNFPNNLAEFYIKKNTIYYKFATNLIGSGLTILGPGNAKISALNSVDIAYVNTSILRAYRFTNNIWAQIGSSLTISGMLRPGITSLNSTTIAIVDLSFGLRTYSWTGSVWSQTGSSLAIPSLSFVDLTTLTSSTIALVDGSLNELRTYSWNGSTWSQVGSGLTLSLGDPSVATLNSTTIALSDNVLGTLGTYSWTGSVWNQTGNSITIPGYRAITELTNTSIALVNDSDEHLVVYEWNGSDWIQSGTSLNMPGIGTTLSLTSLSTTDIVFIDSYLEKLTTYRFENLSWRQLDSINPFIAYAVYSEAVDINTADTLEATGPYGTYQYLYTFYNDEDDTESQASLISEEFFAKAAPVDLTNLEVSTDLQVTHKNIYRIGGAYPNFIYIGQTINANTIFEDEVQDKDLVGKIFNSTLNGAPPDGLRYIKSIFGVFVGAVGSKFYFTRDIGNPNYWPETYYIDFYETITGIGLTGNNIIVFTRYKTFLISGSSANTFVKYTLRNDQGCINHDTIVEYEGSLIFVSTDGVCMLTGNKVTVLSKHKLGKQIFNTLNAVMHDEVYYLQLSDYTILAFDFRYEPSLKYFSFNTNYIVVAEDILYGKINEVSNLLYTLFTGSEVSYGYKTGKLNEGSASHLKNYKTIHISASGEHILYVYIDDVLRLTKVLSGKELYEAKIPQENLRGSEIQYKLTGIGKVNEIEYKATRG